MKWERSETSPDSDRYSLVVYDLESGVEKEFEDLGESLQIQESRLFIRWIGERIFYSYYPTRGSWVTKSINSNGTDPKLISNYLGGISPDGKYLAYVYDRLDRESKVIIRDITGGEVFSKLYEDVSFEGWSPDSRYALYIVSESREANMELVLYDINSGELTTPITLKNTENNIPGFNSVLYDWEDNKLYLNQGVGAYGISDNDGLPGNASIYVYE